MARVTSFRCAQSSSRRGRRAARRRAWQPRAPYRATLSGRAESGAVSGAPAGQCRCLPDPARELRLVEFVELANVEVAGVRAGGFAGRHGTQRAAAEEGQLDVPGEHVDAEEPALALDAVER